MALGEQDVTTHIAADTRGLGRKAGDSIPTARLSDGWLHRLDELLVLVPSFL